MPGTGTSTGDNSAASPSSSVVVASSSSPAGGSVVATSVTPASTPTSTGTTSAGGIGNFGSCTTPQIQFGAGFDNRKETSFEPVDQSKRTLFILLHRFLTMFR